MMKKFLVRILVAVLGVTLMLLVSGLATTWFVERNDFENWETESNILLMDKNEHYDFLFLGMSHARNFARFKNHMKMEQILGRKILNLGKGAARSGIYNQYLYLQYYYQAGNQTDKVVYVLTPILLYSSYLDHASNTFEEEPFSLDFLQFLLKSESPNKYQQAFYYHRTKFRSAWLFHRPKSANGMNDVLEAYDPEKVDQIFELAYLNGTQPEDLARNSSILERTIQLARDHGSDITFFVPPALFGKWKGHDETINLLEKMKDKYGITYADFAESVDERKYYYDHHHLNSLGVEHFASKYLKPFL